MATRVLPHIIPAAPAWPRRLAARLRLWRGLRRERRALAALDPRLLADVGLHPAAAEAEARRPFWDVPPKR
jgi:uncharacterized protein YjiS (DUF1127 family)